MKRLTALFLIFTTTTFATTTGFANDQESFQRIRAEVESFLIREARGLPGAVQIKVGAIDARVRLARCDFLQTFFPTGSRAWGKTAVGVRCPDKTAWTIYVSARVGVVAPYLVAARGLDPGQKVSQADLLFRNGDLTRLPAGTLTDSSQAKGQIAARRIAAGQPLLRSMLRAEKVVRNGQIIGLVAQGAGFRISTEGRAMADAAEGSLVHVRTANGKIISGIVRAGPLVEIIR